MQIQSLLCSKVHTVAVSPWQLMSWWEMFSKTVVSAMPERLILVFLGSTSMQQCRRAFSLCVILEPRCSHIVFNKLGKWCKLKKELREPCQIRGWQGKQSDSGQMELFSYTGPSAPALILSLPSCVIPPLQFPEPPQKASDLFRDWISCLFAHGTVLMLPKSSWEAVLCIIWCHIRVLIFTKVTYGHWIFC